MYTLYTVQFIIIANNSIYSYIIFVSGLITFIVIIVCSQAVLITLNTLIVDVTFSTLMQRCALCLLFIPLVFPVSLEGTLLPV